MPMYICIMQSQKAWDTCFALIGAHLAQLGFKLTIYELRIRCTDGITHLYSQNETLIRSLGLGLSHSPRSHQIIYMFYFNSSSLAPPPQTSPILFLIWPATSQRVKSTWTVNCTTDRSTLPSTCCPRCLVWWSLPLVRIVLLVISVTPCQHRWLAVSAPVFELLVAFAIYSFVWMWT